MKLFIPLLTSLCVAIFGQAVQAQGTFQNLDFGSAAIPPGTAAGTFVSINEAFPGWTGYFGTNQQGSVLYNSLDVGNVNLAILASGGPVGGVIPGNSYTAVIQAGLNNNVVFSAALAQIGLIPADAESLAFEASVPGGSGWSVAIGGQNLQVTPISQINSIYYLYEADISAFAGETNELRFTANSPLNNLSFCILRG